MVAAFRVSHPVAWIFKYPCFDGVDRMRHYPCAFSGLLPEE
jgi:hypothetical protein